MTSSGNFASLVNNSTSILFDDIFEMTVTRLISEENKCASKSKERRNSELYLKKKKKKGRRGEELNDNFSSAGFLFINVLI